METRGESGFAFSLGDSPTALGHFQLKKSHVRYFRGKSGAGVNFLQLLPLPRRCAAGRTASLRWARRRVLGSEMGSRTSVDSCGSFIWEIWVCHRPLVRAQPSEAGPVLPSWCSRRTWNRAGSGVTQVRGSMASDGGSRWAKASVKNRQTLSQTCPTGLLGSAPCWRC